MKITVRSRKAKNGVSKLFLDIYDPSAKKIRTSITLDLFVYENPKGSQKKSNKEAIEAAERIRAKKTIEFAYDNNSLSELSGKDKSVINFIDYFQEQTDKRYDSLGNYGNWDSVCKYLRKFCPDDISINQVDAKFLEDFKYYLEHIARTKSNTKLSQNSLYSYFNKVRACLKQAYREDLILKNPSEKVKGFKQGEVEREYLTFEELQKVAKVDCEIPQLKSAFLFSCLTGIRWSDINNLLWKDLQYSENNSYWFVRFRQQKTKGVETLPISQQAHSLLPEVEADEERIFKGLKYSAWHNMKLQQWVMKAGISKTITFHCARHTYATLQLTNGTDIYTVSKLLGHRELKTTQVYAKIIDQKKVDATNAIPILDL
ncbi:site-specific integrase [Brumimicrobium glaciale]|uniref:Site-specific integrase n=1 Tax=Brumimicrobium glaciale TaxID=200475 RepID=A0A4Q4KN66_9FLAO|nr:site-specific integrase [Brumimicrobium glaciale]RYM34825.1 site-specific integrase [Brumimicrobium glaciale]